jgi:hypothetical protein
MRMRIICWFLAFCSSSSVCSIATANTEQEALDLVDISCTGGHTEKIVYRYSGKNPANVKANSQPLQYDAQDTIYGALTQNIKIDGNGDCYDLVIRLR